MTELELSDDPMDADAEQVRPGSRRCTYCGGVLPAAAAPRAAAETASSADCPHCGGPLAATPSGAHTIAYEDKTAVCLPYELERLARAEAVDGWRLVDTTVSPAVPGMIEVHFRRPLQMPTRPLERSSASTAAGTPAGRARSAPASAQTGPVRPMPEHKPPPTAQPSPQQGLTPEQVRRLVFAGLLLVGLLWATDNFGIVGFLFALWLLPQLLRGIMGSGGKRHTRPRSRHRRR